MNARQLEDKKRPRVVSKGSFGGEPGISGWPASNVQLDSGAYQQPHEATILGVVTHRAELREVQ